MAIYLHKNNLLAGLKEKPFASEREMQVLVEKNLEELFGLKFVASEFAPRGDLRIDTLAFDEEQKSFVIIEYKKSDSWSVMDQGYSYLSLLLDRKADFVLKINESHNQRFTTRNISWEASKVIFIAPSFTTYQIGALGFRDIAFELYKLQRYEGEIISLEQIQGRTSVAKLSEVQTTSEEARRVQREVKKYTIEDHFRSGYEVARELFDILASHLFELDSRLSISPVKNYIGFNIVRKNIFTVHTRRSWLIFHIPRFQPQDLKDPEKKLRYLPHSKEHFNVHISEMRIENKADINYALTLARQILNAKA